MVRGIRPSVPADIPPKMKEVWNIARDCWDQNPQERASFQSVLDKLNDFSRMEDTTPFAVYQPMPMPVNGKQPALRPGMLCRRWNSLEQPKQTTTEWQGLETSGGDSSKEAPQARQARQEPASSSTSAEDATLFSTCSRYSSPPSAPSHSPVSPSPSPPS